MSQFVARDQTVELDLDHVRSQFPALESGSVFLDNPGGTQVPAPVIDAVVRYYREQNANLGGAFRTSRASDVVMSAAREAAADLVGGQPNEIVFGQNMTSLAFHLARSLAERFEPGDEILVTRLDHDANVSPWASLVRQLDLRVRSLPFDPADCTLQLEQLDELLTERTKLVAVGYASNAVGTINAVQGICARASEVGALSFVDAVQYAPHATIAVESLGCDFLACSAYKFFGPHVGILWGRGALLEELEAFKVRPSKPSAPDKFETGTLNHEGIAGTTAAIDYLASLGGEDSVGSRRERLEDAFAAIERHEHALCRQLIDGLQETDGVTVYGITEPERVAERVPTVSFTHSQHHPRDIAERLGEQEIFVWDGDYYAVDVIDDLGLRDAGGMVRVGIAHYNTAEEIERFLNVLA